MLSFQDLTAKTQSRLIIENMQMCYSLTMSYYFFGHNATTAVEQVGIRGNISKKDGNTFSSFNTIRIISNNHIGFLFRRSILAY